ncbi:MAG: 4-alpha-glucanotransferase, partial [Polyangiaceae bacterium]|nr:4-alpha-glucanotransferase [Polyangiaceae bacterium]
MSTPLPSNAELALRGHQGQLRHPATTGIAPEKRVTLLGPRRRGPARADPHQPLELMQNTTRRTCGVLLHPTSLPGPHGIGALGKHARAFVDFLHAAGQGIWQVLPIGPTGYGDSPYACLSTFAGNPLLIDLDTLVEDGLLTADELASAPMSTARVDFGAVIPFKLPLLERAAARFPSRARAAQRQAFEAFCAEHAWWLEEYALFWALKGAHQGRPIHEWSDDVRLREPRALERAREQFAPQLRMVRVIQFLFFEQWAALREYARAKQVCMMGDMPIFVACDSDAVWAHPELFKLDEDLAPTVVAGVPPDYFSETGQLWG